MKNLFQKTMLALTMALMGACDETMMGESDASTPEFCVLYVNPGTEADAGNGESETSPLASMDALVTKASALKARCGDAAEVRIADGALSDEQLGMATASLKSIKLKVGTYSPSDHDDVAPSASAAIPPPAMPAAFVGESTPDLEAHRLSEIEGNSFTQDVVTRQSTVPYWEKLSGSNYIYYPDQSRRVGIGTNSTFSDGVTSSVTV